MSAPEGKLTDRDIAEGLADLAHRRWSGWMRYLFDNSTSNPDGSVTIPRELVLRWTRQMDTPYERLPDAEQDSDRKEARIVVEALKKWRADLRGKWRATSAGALRELYQTGDVEAPGNLLRSARLEGFREGVRIAAVRLLGVLVEDFVVNGGSNPEED